MLSLIRRTNFSIIRKSSSKSNIKDMSPLTLAITKPDAALLFRDVRLVYNEVLRCNAFFDNVVFKNCIQMLGSSKYDNDSTILASIKLISVAFHRLHNDDEKRKKLLELANKIDLNKCRIDIMRNEAQLFFNSLKDDAELPKLEKCLNQSDLVECYFRRALKNSNLMDIRIITENYDHIELEKFTNEIMEVAKTTKAKNRKIFNIFMNYYQKKFNYYLPIEVFESSLYPMLRFTNSSYKKIDESSIDQFEYEFLKQEEIELLKERIDEFIGMRNQGMITSKEIENAIRTVQNWKRKFRNVDGEGVIVVDALNYGSGKDPTDWKILKKTYKHVVFATRTPRADQYAAVKKRYNNNVVFCDKLSADDLVVIRIAWEFGARARLLTNDQYRNHRRILTEQSENKHALRSLWDRWFIDAVYRHDNGNIEKKRVKNIRIHKVDGNSWLVPVIRETSRIRQFSWIRISPPMK